jgi:CheY-like chemotaxis protein
MSTILLIEDNKDTARMVTKILEPKGYTVSHICTGLEGLKMARSLHPDLILLDMDLPDLDGKVVVNQMRADASLATTVIVAFTAENSPRAKRLAMSFGCNDFISKPIDTRTFPETIATLIASKVQHN